MGARIELGYRLACQVWLTHDIELSQEATPLADVVAPGNAD
ncbi:ferredoxin [Bradyrhizobium diazoefficiens]